MASLGLSWTELQVEIADHLGYGRTSSAWTADQTSQLESYVQAGLRQFYWPPPLPGQTEPHKWSFLDRTGTLTPVAADYDYDLASDYGGNARGFTFASGSGLRPLTQISEDYWRTLQAASSTPGQPQFVAVRPKSSTGSSEQTHEALLYPTPSTVPTSGTWTITYHYDVNAFTLSTIAPYPLGGPMHADTLLESCLAIADARRNDGVTTLHHDKFMERLAASVQFDLRVYPPTANNTWPADATAPTTLDLTYTDFLRRVGHELGYSWDTGTWTTDQLRTADMLVQAGFRRFLTPPPLDGQRQGHEWSFLRPLASMTTTAPYTTGTIGIAAGVVTLTDGTFPTWAAQGLLVVEGSTYAVATRDSDTQVTLSDTSVTVTAGAEYSLGRWVYDMPTDFAILDGPLTYAEGSSNYFQEVQVCSEYQVRKETADLAATGYPLRVALRPKAIDMTAATAWEMIIAPIPDAAYTLRYRYRVNISPLGTTNTTPPGGPAHGETIMAACLAEVEANSPPATRPKNMVYEGRFRERLTASISHDRQVMAPDTLGLNRDDSDSPVDAYRCGHDWNTQVVLYNGTAY